MVLQRIRDQFERTRRFLSGKDQVDPEAQEDDKIPTTFGVLLMGLFFILNAFCKGVMKSAGAQMKSLQALHGNKDAYQNFVMNGIHMGFNTTAVIVCCVGSRIGAVKTIVIGLLMIIAGSLYMPYDYLTGGYFGMLTIGTGCACVVHTVTIQSNGAFHHKKNGLVNGVLTSANSLGSTAVMVMYTYIFDQLDPFGSSYITAGCFTFLVALISICLPRIIFRYKKRIESIEVKSFKVIKGSAKVWGNPVLYMFIFAQLLNACGFLNYMTYLPSVIEQKMRDSGLGTDDYAGYVSAAFVTTNVADGIGRILFPHISDKLQARFQTKKIRIIMYIVGTMISGISTFTISYCHTIELVYINAVFVGIGTALFVGNWNSCIKDTVGDRLYAFVYSWSLVVSGISNQSLSYALVANVTDVNGNATDKAGLLQPFGLLLFLSSLSMGYYFLPCFKTGRRMMVLDFARHERKVQERVDQSCFARGPKVVGEDEGDSPN